MSPEMAAYVAWTEHRFFKFRGCAPDPDAPRLAVGSPGVDEGGRPVRVGVDAWLGPDVDGGESLRERTERVEAAREVCLRCPVMVQCDAYANLVPGQADGVRGGRTARERAAVLKAARSRPVRKPAPVVQLRTVQKLAVLAALAVWADEYRVAIETGLDVRKANWQRARLTSGLGLEASASRMDLLAAAVKAGLVDGGLVVADDGSVPAIPPSTRKLLIETADGQMTVVPLAVEEAWDPSKARPWRWPVRGRSVLPRSRFRNVEGQLALDDVDADGPPSEGRVYVHDLFPDQDAPVLEAAA
ncbi:WhiB family transcriptional regulator [Streptomyces sp. NPDC021056]|uniref:WhiB family transcriptional regulator n=1 Tax=Streptomyces sp. NPDC021056 TaxID=3155012 RepID=UPI0033F93978